MKELVKGSLALRSKCKAYGNQIKLRLNLPEDTVNPRVAGFNRIFNDVTSAYELLAYYYSIWKKHPPIRLVPQLLERVEIVARCMGVLKYVFVFSLSSMEFTAKDLIQSYPEESPSRELFMTKNKNKYIYLRDIMANSKKEELIDGDMLVEWKHIIDIRNCVVHNNARAWENETYTIGRLIVETTRNQTMKGKKDFFLALTDLTVDRYYYWVNELITKYDS